DADDHVGEGEGLHDGVDGLRAGLDVVEDGRRAARLVPDLEQQDVGRGLQHAEAHHQVDEVAAGDDPVEPDEEEPGGQDVRCRAHSDRMMSACSRNSSMISSSPAATSMPTKRLRTGMVPAEKTLPVEPRGRTFSRKAAPASMPTKPMTTNAPAPEPSPESSTSLGPSWRKVM